MGLINIIQGLEEKASNIRLTSIKDGFDCFIDNIKNHLKNLKSYNIKDSDPNNIKRIVDNISNDKLKLTKKEKKALSYSLEHLVKKRYNRTLKFDYENKNQGHLNKKGETKLNRTLRLHNISLKKRKELVSIIKKDLKIKKDYFKDVWKKSFADSYKFKRFKFAVTGLSLICFLFYSCNPVRDLKNEIVIEKNQDYKPSVNSNFNPQSYFYVPYLNSKKTNEFDKLDIKTGNELINLLHSKNTNCVDFYEPYLKKGHSVKDVDLMLMDFIRKTGIKRMEINIPSYELRIIQGDLIIAEIPVGLGENKYESNTNSRFYGWNRTPIGVGYLKKKMPTLKFINKDPETGEIKVRKYSKITAGTNKNGKPIKKLIKVPYDDIRGFVLQINNEHYVWGHSTTEPESVGKKSSHGCIRFTIPDGIELYPLLKENMPVLITYNLNEFDHIKNTILTNPDNYGLGYTNQKKIKDYNAKCWKYGIRSRLGWTRFNEQEYFNSFLNNLKEEKKKKQSNIYFVRQIFFRDEEDALVISEPEKHSDKN